MNQVKRIALLLVMIGLLTTAVWGTTTLLAAPTANEIVVTTTADGLNTMDGQCSLREAIVTANKNDVLGIVIGECPSGSDTEVDRIILASGETYALTEAGDDSETGDLDIVDNVNAPLDVEIVTAEPGSPATIDATAVNDRVMQIINATVVISNVTMTGGETDAHGGGLAVEGADVTLTNVSVQNNSAQNGGGIANMQGGKLTLTNGQVILNESKNNGGGILNELGGTTLTLNGVIVRVNTAVNHGGGIYNSEGGLLTVQENSAINLNRATGDGGGIFNETGGMVTVRNSTLEGNDAGYNDNMNEGDGGAIYSAGENNATLALQDVTIMGNSASRNGGGVHAISNTPHLIISGGQFLENTAEVSGGGLVGNGSLTNIEFGHNTAVVYGGGIVTNDLDATGLYIHSNTAGAGGGILANKVTQLSQSRVLSNTANVENGGGLLISGEVHDNSISRTVFAYNQAEEYGGGLGLQMGNLALTNSTVSSNRINGNGSGAGVAIGGNSTLTATNVTIALNLVGLDVYKEGEMIMQNSLIFTPDQPNCNLVATPIVSLGHNLTDDDSCAGLDEETDSVSSGIGLQPLADNGGNTLTHAISKESTAVDAGNNEVCTTSPVNGVDQRGFERPSGTACDIGAFEGDFTYKVMLPLIMR